MNSKTAIKVPRDGVHGVNFPVLKIRPSIRPVRESGTR